MAPIQTAIAQVGLSKQTDKVTLAASPTFGHGVTGGAIVTVELDQELEDRTSHTRVSPSVNRNAVVPGFDVEGRAHPKSVGLWLYGALGAISTSGSATYTHVITVGDDLPYLSVFGKLGSNVVSVRGCKVDELKLSWEESKPVELTVSGTGCVASAPGTGWPVVVDDARADYFTAAAGTFKLDVDSDTAVTASVTGGEISIANGLEPIILSGSVTPDDVMPGRVELEVTLDIVIADLSDFRRAWGGSDAATEASPVPVYGSFEVEFVLGTNRLKFAGTHVAFVTEFPEADPSGGAATLSLAGMITEAANGSTLTATLVNAQASY